MMSSTTYQRQSLRNLNTIDVFDAGNRLIIEERSKHDASRLVVEVALCVVVGVMLLGSFLLLILPEFPLFNQYFGVSLSMVMVGIAVSLYVFATRGFKPQVGYDKLKKQFWVCKLNSHTCTHSLLGASGLRLVKSWISFTPSFEITPYGGKVSSNSPRLTSLTSWRFPSSYRNLSIASCLAFSRVLPSPSIIVLK